MKKRNKLSVVRSHYPNAITTVDAVNRMFDILEKHYDIDPFEIMAADSICSDDVNSIEYPQRASEMLGPFKMGGLDGFPFTGLTGMGAFAGHVPDDGAVFIYYAPHIGITKNGEVGLIHRIGQHKPSGCCGAARAALAKLQSTEIKEGHLTDIDYQMNNQLMEATEVMYEAIDKRIHELAAQTKYNCKYLILIGAILINGDFDMGSFSANRRFDVLNLETKELRSHMDEL
jgi:Limiting CO2-inducible proteins B/C beta carbonyic anhydrases